MNTTAEKSTHQQAVELFMSKAGQELPTKPTVPSPEIRKLRAQLILEEALETIEALGFEVEYWDYELHLKPGKEPILTDILDGCCDLAVVTTGTLSACGISDIVPQDLVNYNNIQKFDGWTTNEMLSYGIAKSLIEIEEFAGKQSSFSNFSWTKLTTGKYLVKSKQGKLLKHPSHKKPSLGDELERQSNL